MNSFERFAELTSLATLESWRDRVCDIGEGFGYRNFAMVIFPEFPSRIELGAAFVQTNYAPAWSNKYIDEQFGYIDPTVSHCLTKSTPLIWWPDKFSDQAQRAFFEEAYSFGICSGVSFPVHGPNGEHGIISFASDTKPDRAFLEMSSRNIPELSCFRDFVFETSLQFMGSAALSDEEEIALTQREMECLRWSASGKSSWDIAYIMNCTEAGINAHFFRICRKFGTSTRRQAIVKAIRLGIITPS